MSELDHTTKSAAKRIAREITAEIADRHLRARLRTQCYNRTVSLLDELNRSHSRRATRTRQAALTAGIAGVMLGSLSVWALLA